MPPRALRPCKQAGCRNLVQSGYCEQHQAKAVSNVQSLRALDDKKTDEDRDFYQSWRWRKLSEQIRKEEPLCRECYKNGLRGQVAHLVHHEPERKVLISKGLDPYDPQYLVPICNNCHQRHLNEKRWK